MVWMTKLRVVNGVHEHHVAMLHNKLSLNSTCGPGDEQGTWGIYHEEDIDSSSLVNDMYSLPCLVNDFLR